MLTLTGVNDVGRRWWPDPGPAPPPGGKGHIHSGSVRGLRIFFNIRRKLRCFKIFRVVVVPDS